MRRRWTLLLGLALLLITGCASVAKFMETDVEKAQREAAEQRAVEEAQQAKQDSIAAAKPLEGIRYLNRETGDTIEVLIQSRGPAGRRARASVIEDGSIADGITVEKLGPVRGGAMIVTAQGHLNVRSCPSTDCKVLRQLSRYDRRVVTTFEDGWWALEEGGYVSAKYMVLPQAWTILQEALVEKVTVEDMPKYTGLLPLSLPPHVDLVGTHLDVEFRPAGPDAGLSVRVCRTFGRVADYFEYEFPEAASTTEIRTVSLRVVDSWGREYARLVTGGGIECTMQ